MQATEALRRMLAASDDPIPSRETGASWGSPKRYRQQLILDEMGAKGLPSGGYAFPDGSALASLLAGPMTREWTVLTSEQIAERTTGVRASNTVGLTGFRVVELGGGQYGLEDQLTRAGMPFVAWDEPSLQTWSGPARVVVYTGRATGQPVTAILAHDGLEGDSPQERVYTFAGMDEDTARDFDWFGRWEDIDAATKLD